MFGLRPKLPISEVERIWVDDGFARLGRMLGWSRLQNASVILPNDEFFPDPWSATESGAQILFRRVCNYMGVNPSLVELAVIPDESELVEMLPAYSYQDASPAGLHFGARFEKERPLIAVRRSLLKDPLTVVATLAHELGHVILLGGGHLQRDAEDMEPMTDLVTVYLGLGVFTANASRRFIQYQEDRRYGWSMNRLGYLPEEVYAYALARFAKERGEVEPKWVQHLSTNLKAWFLQSARYIKNESKPIE